MEVGGIEPPSENLLAKTSPITVGYFSFPLLDANQQASGFGSFYCSFFTTKLLVKKCPAFSTPVTTLAGSLGPATAYTKRQKLIRYCRFFLKGLVFLRRYRLRMAIYCFLDPRRNHYTPE